MHLKSSTKGRHLTIRYHGSSSSTKYHVSSCWGLERRHTPVVCKERKPHTSQFSSSSKFYFFYNLLSLFKYLTTLFYAFMIQRRYFLFSDLDNGSVAIKFGEFDQHCSFLFTFQLLTISSRTPLAMWVNLENLH